MVFKYELIIRDCIAEKRSTFSHFWIREYKLWWVWQTIKIKPHAGLFLRVTSRCQCCKTKVKATACWIPEVLLIYCLSYWWEGIAHDRTVFQTLMSHIIIKNWFKLTVALTKSIFNYYDIILPYKIIWEIIAHINTNKLFLFWKMCWY